jgi:hypothetical protein
MLQYKNNMVNSTARNITYIFMLEHMSNIKESYKKEKFAPVPI